MSVHLHARLLFLWSVSCGHLARDFRRLFIPWRLALQFFSQIMRRAKARWLTSCGHSEHMIHSLAISCLLLHCFLQLKLSGVCCCTFLTFLGHGRLSPLGHCPGFAGHARLGCHFPCTSASSFTWSVHFLWYATAGVEHLVFPIRSADILILLAWQGTRVISPCFLLRQSFPFGAPARVILCVDRSFLSRGRLPGSCILALLL